MFLGNEGNLNAAKKFKRNKKKWQTPVVLDTWDGVHLGGNKSGNLADIKYHLLAMRRFAVMFNGRVIISYHKRS